jgi:hypothetical protein
LICPFCKNEKLNESVCPFCKLDGAAALLESARKHQDHKKWVRAANGYRRYLEENPKNAGVLARLAYCAWQEALLLRTPEAVDQADKDLFEALSQDWAWEAGHQYRVHLSVLRGSLPDLKKEYELAARTDPAREETALSVLKTIGLTEKFTERTAFGNAERSKRTDLWFFLRIYWPLGAGILLTSAFSAVISGETYGPKTLLFFTSLVLFSDFALIVFSFYLYRKVKLKDRKREYEKNLRSIGPPDLSDWNRK